ncbi:hypothetical protein CVT25_006142 [Psilocybe cyanescens]|uniref:T-complex protein 1 subunit gamma n=1 Tax=Psilocybe cyanescens TaxID=93625 RepID=A0A409WYV5_PSICY|nr:hypothetical protein CVT25_006142 [Psilocybe cyanescens]
MILYLMGSIVLTNDGNAILREIDVAYPAAKNTIELSRTRDEECGDNTTRVIILAGEILAQSLSQLERDIHPVVTISAYNKALAEVLSIIQRIFVPIDTAADAQMLALIRTSIGIKFVACYSDMMCALALQAVCTVAVSHGHGAAPGAAAAAGEDAGGCRQGHVHRQTNADIKKYTRVEKILSGEIEESRVLSGTSRMHYSARPPARVQEGRVADEHEVQHGGDLGAHAQEIEEEQVKQPCERLLELKPDLVVTERGVSGMFFCSFSLSPFPLCLSSCVYINTNNNISPPSQTSRSTHSRKSDNNRIALAVGATIVNRIEDIRESDVGTRCGLFRVENIGDEPSKHILNETDHNLADAMSVACNAFFNPTFCPGGGATEMTISVGLQQRARGGAVQGLGTWPYRAVADVMEVIPRVLIQNSGGNAIRVLTELRAKRVNGEHSWGVNGDTDRIVDMKEYGLYESASVKIQTLKTATKAARMLFRVDDVVQAVRKEQEGGGGASALPREMMEVQ